MTEPRRRVAVTQLLWLRVFANPHGTLLPPELDQFACLGRDQFVMVDGDLPVHDDGIEVISKSQCELGSVPRARTSSD